MDYFGLSRYIEEVRPLAPRALVFLLMSGAVQAGQVEVPVSGQSRPGTQAGTIGGGLAAPAPLQMKMPLLSESAPLLAPDVSPHN